MLIPALLLHGTAFSQNRKKTDSLIALIPVSPDSQKITLYNALGVELWFSDIIKSDSFINEALALSKKINSTQGIARSYNNLGVVCWIKGDYVKAEQLYLKSANEWKKNAHGLGLYGTYGNLALLYSETGKWSKSIQLHLASLDYWKKTNNRFKIASTYNNLGELYHQMGNYKESFNYYIQSLKMNTELKDETGVTESALGLSNYYRHIKDSKEALRYASIAMEKSRKTNDTRHLSFSYQVTGNIYFDNKKYQQALQYYFRQKKLFNKYPSPGQETINLFNIGTCYNELGEYKKSKTYFLQCLDQTKQTKDSIMLSEIYSCLYICYYKEKDFKRALDYYTKHTALEDSIYSLEKLKAVDEIRQKYESEKKDNAILVLEKKHEEALFEIADKKKEFRITMLFIVIAVLVLVFVIYTFGRYRSNKSKIELLEVKELFANLKFKMLMLQVNPHFYFNTLNNIYGQLIEEKSSPKSQELLLKLSELMRFLVENSEEEEILLTECVKFLESYFLFEKERLGNRCNLVFEKEITNSELRIAHFVIFPLVENAFKYGSNRITPFDITIRIEGLEDKFRLITKNEIIAPEATSTSTGTGIKVIKKCLDNFYRGRYDLQIKQDQKHFEVNLEIRFNS